VYVHRDYMPRNLMLSVPNPGVLDFQDAVYGPLAYDPICLFKDAFLSWPAEHVEGWLRQYWEKAGAVGLPVPAWPDFRRDCDWIGLQRHLKVAGIFARINYRDGKPKYLADTPRFIRYAMEVAPKYPELRPLADLIERHVLPKVEL
jgi:aminoglycoside/choline kinase family phosphotransferase